jgi:hypothetical protein
MSSPKSFPVQKMIQVHGTSSDFISLLELKVKAASAFRFKAINLQPLTGVLTSHAGFPESLGPAVSSPILLLAEWCVL